ncbi:MAG: hypothetical protein KatS3mg009_0068 [Acidimicrobiia bacterium]|nr:MAG: hypothetical protein KatS3mg009_0068 [Acidimicrobiia bacterium]
MPPAERIRTSWQRRPGSDYLFDFWSAFGWSVLTCGFYSYYVLFQLMRRARDHNARRLEMLEAARTYAWERALGQGVADELTPAFERVAAQLAVLQQKASEFRDPALWLVLAILTGGIATYVAWILLDADLDTHDRAEVSIEAELAQIYARLGVSIPTADPLRVKGRHNYVGRVVATIATCGVYGLFWLYDLMVEGNRHFEANWAWEDDLARAVQALEAA